MFLQNCFNGNWHCLPLFANDYIKRQHKQFRKSFAKKSRDKTQNHFLQSKRNVSDSPRKKTLITTKESSSILFM